MLHIINKSPLTSGTFESCLNTAVGGDILLIEDAVYAATKGCSIEAKTKAAMGKFKVYVLMPDLEARGLTEEDFVVGVVVLSRAEMGKLMDEQDVVLSF